MATKNCTVDAEKLADFTTKVLKKVGVPEEDAQLKARILVATDLGIDTHGTASLAGYVKGIKEGRINRKPNVKIFSRTPATATMDGDQGPGLYSF